MARQDFLTRLFKKKKIVKIEPSERIAVSFIEKSKRYFSTAYLLIDNKRYEESISMSYYSMYYSLLALLFRVGIKSENHTASIALLKKVFSIDNSGIGFAKSERVDKQYYVDFVLSEEDAKNLLETVQKFNFMLKEKISRLNEIEVYSFRKKFDELFS